MSAAAANRLFYDGENARDTRIVLVASMINTTAASEFTSSLPAAVRGFRPRFPG